MTLNRKTVSVACLVLLASMLRASAAEPLQVSATTSLLASAIRDVGGGRVSVNVLIAPGGCPGHFDISPKEVKKLSASRAVFMHGYEAFVSKMLLPMGSRKPRKIVIDADGNWMVPSVYLRASRIVAAELCRIDPANASGYRKCLALLESRASALDRKLKSRLKSAGASRIVALCSDMQEPVARWMGLDVVETFPRAEEFTPALMHYLTGLGRKKKVALVIDNLQSGPDAGKGLARDIGAAHITLSNFPGAFPRTGDWASSLKDSVNRVLTAVRRR